MMRKTNRAATTTALVAAAFAAIAAGTGNAHADSGAAATSVDVQIMPGVRYTGDASDRSAQISTPFGSVTTSSGRYQIRDSSGHIVFGTPSAGPDAAANVPTAHDSSPAPAAGRLSEHVQATAPTPDVALRPVDSGTVDTPAPADRAADLSAAEGAIATDFGLATGVGAMVGGVGGAVIGCPLGAVTGGLVAVPTTLATLSLPAAALGCVLGAATVGGLGAVVGGAVVGAPVGIASAVQQYNTLHARGEL